MTHPAVFRPLQARFLSIPQAPLCYWLRERFFELLAGRTLGEVAEVPEGLGTRDDARFVRFVWEVPPGEWGRPVRERRWVPFEKGGGYGKWFGHHFWAVDWAHEGARIKAFPASVVRNEQHYFKEGWTYSHVARGSLGFRMLLRNEIISDKSAGVIFPRHIGGAAATINCRMSSFAARSSSQSIDIRESYVARVPLPQRIPDLFATLESTCIALKRYLVALDPTERSFGGIRVAGASLTEVWGRLSGEAEGVAAVLHALEGLSERKVFAVYGIAGEDLQSVLDETGTPAGWYPLLAGRDACPTLPASLEVPGELLAPLACEPRRTLSAAESADIKRWLRALYEAGPGAEVEEDEPTGGDESDEEDSVGQASLPVNTGARIPIPAETFLEELSQKIEVHPISVFWLLRELRDNEGVVCPPELRRFAEDYVSITVLRLLGHRWPVEQASSLLLAGKDACPTGIVPLTEGTGELTLLARLRERIAADFSAEPVSAVEREFEEIVGKPLAAWLASDFFRRHISQFRKRPIIWQLTSSPGNNERRRGRGAGRNAPVFSCLVYYHRLDADLFPKLRSQYVGPLRLRFQTELAGLEKIHERTADQDAQRVELEGKIEELKAFEARIEEVIVRGFDCAALAESVAKEPMDKWTSRDGTSAHPSTREALLAQERGYAPDLNDGVRVNVAPLQKAGLLAADVLAPKDVEKAISDRAEWRADERRWCREGKLPRPGWWPEGAR